MTKTEKGVPVMTAKEISNYELQTVKMCIQTYYNLYGVMPGTRDMLDWLGETYAKVISMFLPEQHAA